LPALSVDDAGVAGAAGDGFEAADEAPAPEFEVCAGGGGGGAPGPEEPGPGPVRITQPVASPIVTRGMKQ